MVKDLSRRNNFIFQAGAVVVALIFTTLVMVLAGAPPFQTYWLLIKGAVGSFTSIADVIVAWVPLLLTASGVLITFTAGLWNLGVEGQITIGAIFTTGVLRFLQDTSMPPALIIILAILAGMVGGALWAALAGALKTFGGVSEIFGGLGLNFVATSLTIWLVFGPWKRPGVGSMSGTETFPETLWLPLLPGFRLSIWTVILAAVAIVVTYFLLKGTYFGLKLKAVGNNMRSSFLLGIPTWQYMMLSFILCGAFAGLAGAVQVTAVYHRLIPSISSGYGFLGLMVGMLINFQAIWVAPVALFFAALNIGSIQLPIVLKLDSALSGIIQGSMVLFVLLMDGVRRQYAGKLFRRTDGE